MKKKTRHTANRPHECVCGQLQKTTRCITQLYDRLLRPAGLRNSQYAMLVNIGRADSPSVGELGALLRMDQSTAVRNLAVLKREGWVEIFPDRDIRRKRVSLTPEGRKRLDEALPHWEKAQRAIAAVLPPGQLAALSRLLKRIQEVSGSA